MVLLSATFSFFLFRSRRLPMARGTSGIGTDEYDDGLQSSYKSSLWSQARFSYNQAIRTIASSPKTMAPLWVSHRTLTAVSSTLATPRPTTPVTVASVLKLLLHLLFQPHIQKKLFLEKIFLSQNGRGFVWCRRHPLLASEWTQLTRSREITDDGAKGVSLVGPADSQTIMKFTKEWMLWQAEKSLKTVVAEFEHDFKDTGGCQRVTARKDNLLNRGEKYQILVWLRHENTIRIRKMWEMTAGRKVTWQKQVMFRYSPLP